MLNVIPFGLPFFGERGKSFAGFITVSGGKMRLDKIRTASEFRFAETSR